MDEEIKEVGEMATIEGEEEITINEDYTALEAETIIIDDDSNIQTDAEYEQAVGQKELADEAREALSAVLLSVLEKGEINDDDIAEIAAQQEIYTENVTALKILGLTTEDEKSTAGKSTTNVITSNIDYDELIKVLSEKADWLYIDEDGQVMLNGEVVPKIKVVELEAEKIKADVGEFKDLTTENFTATNANITNLRAEYGEFKNLTTENFTATNADITNLKANKADIEYLDSNYATIQNLNTNVANINNALIDKANVSDLNTTNANITNLQATKADITDLNVANGDISNLKVLVANIQTLIGGNLTMDNIQSLVLTSDKVTIADALIKNAMIDSVSANKINTGIINTNNVSIQSEDGSMLINGTTQQFKDENNKVRIQIGKDAQGDFTFALFSQDGVGVLIDENGIKSGAVPDGLIVNNMISDGANISGSKLDINSVISSINNGTTTIQGTRVQLDEQGQSLQVAFSQLKSKVETIENISIDGDLSSVIEQVTSNTTSINTMQGQISSLISNTTITKANGEVVQLKDEYNSTKSTVDSHATKIGSLETNLATANNNISSVSSKQTALEQNLNGFKQTVSDTYTTKTDFNDLDIGGTNLYPNSNFKTEPTYTERIGGSQINWDSSIDSDTVTTKYNGNLVQLYDSQGTSGNEKDIYIAFSQTATLQPNTTYTLSFDYYSIGAFEGSSSYIYLWNAKGDSRQTIYLNVINNMKNRTRLVKTFSTGSEYLIFQFRIGFQDTGPCWLAVDGVKLEEGNRATAWSPSPEDIDSAINTVDVKFANYSTTQQMNSAIDQKANEITSTVSNTYATKSELKTTDDKFANYSTTSDMNSAITQKSNEILSTVSNTYATKTALSNVDSKFADYSTTAAMNTAIDQKANEITSSVSQTYTTKADFNNLAIGGTNLVTGTKNFDGWYYDGFTLVNEQYDGTFKGCYINWTGTSGNRDVSKNNSVYLEPDTEYTLSFWARGYGQFWSYLYWPGTATVASGYNSSGATTTNSDGSIVNTLTDNDNFKRYWITWKTVSNLTPGKYNIIPCRVASNLGDCQMIICGIKIEKGNRTTAWTPAPQDIDNSITAVDNKFTNYSTTSQMNSAIDQKANEITSTVSETYATKASLTTVDNKFASYSTISDMNTAINQKAESIAQSVSNTYATKTSLNSANNNITSLTNRMDSAESKLTKDSLTTTIGNYYTTSTDVDGIVTSKGYATTSQVSQTATNLTAKFKSTGGINLIRNSTAIGGTNGWQGNIAYSESDWAGKVTGNRRFFYINNKNTTENYAFSPRFALKANTTYTLSCWIYRNTTSTGYDVFVLASTSLPWTDTSTGYNNTYHMHVGSSTSWERVEKTFTTGANDISGYVRIDNNGYTGSGDANSANIHFASLMLTEGTIAHPWTPHPSECYSGITQIDGQGIKVMHDSIDGNSYTHMSPSGFYIKYKGEDKFICDSNGLTYKGTITGSTIKGSIFKSGAGYNPNKQNITGLQMQDDTIYSYGTKNNGMYAVTKIAGGTINIGNGEDGAGLNWSTHISPSDISLFKHGSTSYFYVGTTNAPGSGYSTTTTTIDTTTINIGSKDETTALKVDYNGQCEFGNNYFTRGSLTINQLSQGVAKGTQTYLSGTTISATNIYQNGSNVSGSDIILKDNIKEYKDSALDIINKTKVYSFNRILANQDKTEIGFLAQQVPDIFVFDKGEFTAEELEGLTAQEKQQLLDKKTKEHRTVLENKKLDEIADKVVSFYDLNDEQTEEQISQIMDEYKNIEYEVPISTINQNNIIAIMFKAIQELSQKVEELKKDS